MKIPRVIIAGVTSGVGKTSITIGLIHALIKIGYKVQGFKIGPDYIDTSYHTLISNRDSKNLDAWLMNDVIGEFVKASMDSNISVIEGVMGLFDGISGKNDKASTAHIARLLKAPIILVIDASKTARSVAAIAYGFMKFDPRLDIAGVILNNIASERHERYCLDALRGVCKVLGIVRRDERIRLDERHLGLIPTYEDISVRERAREVAERVSLQLDIKRIIEIAENAPALDYTVKKRKEKREEIRIGVALDNSFNFYYDNNLQRLRDYGAELVTFSPINDKIIPEVNGLYIGGGFPEILAKELAENVTMINSIRKAAEYLPIYAECGGLMYLSKSITDFDGKVYDMVGLFDLDTVMTKSLTLNYTYASTLYDSIIINKGSIVKGHEFHHSIMQNIPHDAKFAYQLRKGKGIDGSRDGIMVKNTLASYMHLYLNDSMAKKFVESCSNTYKY
ncbi:MAG: cobyrinate a,c-diamide synthase [Candidatus Nitrosocaldaceae archaeon]